MSASQQSPANPGQDYVKHLNEWSKVFRKSSRYQYTQSMLARLPGLHRVALAIAGLPSHDGSDVARPSWSNDAAVIATTDYLKAFGSFFGNSNVDMPANLQAELTKKGATQAKVMRKHVLSPIGVDEAKSPSSDGASPAQATSPLKSPDSTSKLLVAVGSPSPLTITSPTNSGNGPLSPSFCRGPVSPESAEMRKSRLRYITFLQKTNRLKIGVIETPKSDTQESPPQSPWSP